MRRFILPFVVVVAIAVGLGGLRVVAQDATPTTEEEESLCPSGMATPVVPMNGTPETMASPTMEMTTPQGSPMASPTAEEGCEVEIEDFAFNPPTIEIAVGTTVTWENYDSAPHTSTADDGSWDSGELAQDATFSHTFDTAGSFTYHCTIHPNMTGTVNVS